VTILDFPHERYGQHLSHAKVENLVKSFEEAVEHVYELLFRHVVELWELQNGAAEYFIKPSQRDARWSLTNHAEKDCSRCASCMEDRDREHGGRILTRLC
jgi:hypothetical protein